MGNLPPADGGFILRYYRSTWGWVEHAWGLISSSSSLEMLSIPSLFSFLLLYPLPPTRPSPSIYPKIRNEAMFFFTPISAPIVQVHLKSDYNPNHDSPQRAQSAKTPDTPPQSYSFAQPNGIDFSSWAGFGAQDRSNEVGGSGSRGSLRCLDGRWKKVGFNRNNQERERDS
ncbi:hypothetical protein BU16DRAFT_43014 [Lophium mytilinum]|uniref:Uncharacterized protein n=1 Tax=Lophium mytilinum TaxID=390894 RepID=A0A6A6QQX6_9PEZI|nr:hypothetical protein BU16DRAFT_43014 [Lophium mytilinum]